MGIIGRKKKSELPDDKDLELLDSSVNKLSQQTSALLSHFGESKQKKPSDEKNTKKVKKIDAPKKRVAKSFDIIASPNKTTKLKAKLKTVETAHGVELLPEHATDSYNEKPGGNSLAATVNQTSSSPSEAQEQLPTIHNSHNVGSLNMKTPAQQEGVEVDIVTGKEAGTDKDSSDKLEVRGQAPVGVAQAGQTLKFDDNKDDESRAPEVHKEADVKTASISKDESLNDATSNLINNTQSISGYKTPDSQQKPTVFDTNEYHLELHDWSKLEYKSNTLWYLLALLLAIFASGIFFVVGGFSMPFIG